MPRTLPLLLVLCHFFTASVYAQEAKPPLQLQLTLKRGEFRIDRSDKEKKTAFEAGSEVIVMVELKNTGKEALDLFGAPEPELLLAGPRKESVRQGGGHFFFVDQSRHFRVAAGDTLRVPLESLTFRKDTGRHFVSWTEPGEFSLQAVWSLAISPAPAGAAAAKGPIPMELKDKVFGQVTVKSEAVKFTVREGKTIDFWIEALSDKDEEVRQAAVSILRRRGKEAAPAAAALTRLFIAERTSAQIEIAETLESLGKSAGKAASGALTKALAADSIALRAASAKALARAAPEDKETGAALAPLLGDTYAEVRRAAAEAFHFIGHNGGTVNPKEVTALIETLNRDPDTMVRYHTLHALYHASEERVVAAILPFLKDSEPAVKSAALYSLGRLMPFMPKEVKAKEDGPLRQTLNHLIELLDDKDKLDANLCEAIVYVVGNYGEAGKPAVPMLRAVLGYPQFAGKENGHQRTCIVISLRNIGPGAKDATPDLTWRLQNDMNFSVRQYAAEALGAIGSAVKEDATGPLSQALNDKAVQVRQAALMSLRKMEAVKELIGALDRETGDTRGLAASLLGEIEPRPKAAIPRLAKMAVSDEDVQARRSACYTLGTLGGEDAIPQLIQAIWDKDAVVRAYAARSLEVIKEKTKSIPALLERLPKETNVETRHAYVRALFLINLEGQKAGAAQLVPLLEDPNEGTRQLAVLLLGQLGPAARDAAPALRRLAEGGSGFMRDEAAKALKKIEMK